MKARCSVTFADHAGSAPMSVVGAAKDYNKDAEPEFDEVWLVFDTEGPQNVQRQKEARNAVEAARQLKYETAISNPCFEYWLLLHYERFTGTLPHCKAARVRLRDHLADYEKGCDCYSPTRVLLDIARRTAAQLFAERCDQNNGHPCDCHPCTQLFRLMDSLLG